MTLTLLIGNKAYSSWSMRPWLVLKEFAIPFEERVTPLYRPESKQELLAFSPAGKVPSLRRGELVVWDSLSIIEYLAETFVDRAIWPKDPAARLLARSLSAEMHSGFLALRNECPTNFRRRPSVVRPSEAAAADVARIDSAWRDARARYGGGGPFLFGAFSAADAMFAPVVCRFSTYGLDVSPEALAYMTAIQALPSWNEWMTAAQAESWIIEKFET